MTQLALRAGRVDITPAQPLPLFGRAGRTGRSQGIASRLEANCILLEQSEDAFAALIAIDSLYPSQLLVDMIARLCSEAGLPLTPADILIVASHTHNAPALDPTKPLLGDFAPDYLQFVAKQIAECLGQLRQEPSSPLQMLASHSDCRASVFRRLWVSGLNLAPPKFSKRLKMAPNEDVSIDQRLKLIVLRSEEEVPNAVIWTWPCHAVSHPDASEIGADFPGALREHIRQSLGDERLPVLYMPGFSGDIRPSGSSALPLHKSGSWIGIGARFAKSDAARVAGLHDGLAQAFTSALGQLDDCGSLGNMAFTREQRSLALGEVRTEAAGIAPLTCQEWAIGPFTIKAVSSEIASGYSLKANGEEPLTFTTGCAGQVFGYLPIDSQIGEGGYEDSGFAPLFSIPGVFHQSIQDQISRLIG